MLLNLSFYFPDQKRDVTLFYVTLSVDSKNQCNDNNRLYVLKKTLLSKI